MEGASVGTDQAALRDGGCRRQGKGGNRHGGGGHQAKGASHDIGKNLVMAMLEGAGYAVVDQGFDVKREAFVSAVLPHRPAVMGMSGLLRTTVQNMPLVVQALEEANLRGKVLVAMGGTCITREFARAAGADIWAEDAASAVKKINSALKGGRSANQPTTQRRNDR